MKTSEVIKTILAERGISQAELARKLNLTPQSVTLWVQGKSIPKGKNLETLSDVLGVPPATLLGYEHETVVKSTTIEIDDEYVSVPFLDIRGSCGHNEIENPVQSLVRMVRVAKAWLASKCPSISFKHLEIITASGDSMSPTINNLDFVFVDRSITNFRDDGIYAVVFSGKLYLKRVQGQIDGGVALHSDNPRYPPIMVSPDQIDLVHVVGKCQLRCSANEI